MLALAPFSFDGKAEEGASLGLSGAACRRPFPAQQLGSGHSFGVTAAAAVSVSPSSRGCTPGD